MTANAGQIAGKAENPFSAMRLKLGLTRETLAERSAVSLQTIVTVEEDPVSLPLHELSQLANYLNLDPGEVFAFLHEKMAGTSQKGKVR